MAEAETLWGLLGEVAGRHGARPALVDAGAGERRVTFAELQERSAAVSGGLRRLGLGRGDAVAVFLPTGAEWVEVLFAAARLGVGVVGVNTRYRGDDLRHLLRVSQAKVLVVADRFGGVDLPGIVADALAEGTGALACVVVAPGPAAAGWRDLPVPAVGFADLASGGGEAAPEPAGRASDFAIAFTTSGTTGLPKLAAHDQASVVLHARNTARAFGVRPIDAGLVALPLCGTFGFSSALAMLAGGAACVLQARFDATEAARLVERHRVSHFNGADGMLAAILATEGAGGCLASWREGVFANFANGGAEVVAGAEELVGARLTGVYGSSECFALLARWPADAPAELRRRDGGLLVGDGLEVRAADPATGAVLGPGEEGELQFRGYAVTSGYLGDEEATRAAFTTDGWYRSGDLGATLGAAEAEAGRGFLYRARLKDSLRLRGFLVDPVEIERRLGAHPGVRLAQVVGVAVPGEGDVAVAFVQPEPGAAAPPDEEELRRFCGAGIADYKVPRRVVLVGAFPTVDGPNGVKIRKADLRDEASRLLAAAPTGQGAGAGRLGGVR